MKPSRMSAYRREKYRVKHSVTITADISALDELLDRLGENVYEAIRPAAQAASQVLYEEVKRNVAAIGSVTGSLESSIYQVYSLSHSVVHQRAVYHISWNSVKAPHGHLIEFGHVQRYRVVVAKDGKWITLKNKPLVNGPRHVRAMPFIRPALSKFPLAVEAAAEELIRRAYDF